MTSNTVAPLFYEHVPNPRRTWVWTILIMVFSLFIAGQVLVLIPADRVGLITEETVEKYPNILVLIVGIFSMVALLFAAYIRFLL